MKHFEIYKKDPATGALYPEGQRRKKGLARILEIVVRDFWQLLGSGLIATAAALPYGLCIMLFLPSSALGPLILSCVVTGALASVFGMNLLDTILRCLRDEAGFWSFQYKKALRVSIGGESAASVRDESLKVSTAAALKDIEAGKELKLKALISEIQIARASGTERE